MPGSPGLRPVGVTAVVVLYFAINAVVVLYFAVALGVVSDVSSMNAAASGKWMMIEQKILKKHHIKC